MKISKINAYKPQPLNHPKCLHTHTSYLPPPSTPKNVYIMENIRDDGICPFPILKAIFNFLCSVSGRNKKRKTFFVTYVVVSNVVVGRPLFFLFLFALYWTLLTLILSSLFNMSWAYIKVHINMIEKCYYNNKNINIDIWGYT